MDAISTFFDSGSLPGGMNSSFITLIPNFSFITLIPKMDMSVEVKDFKPIC